MGFFSWLLWGSGYDVDELARRLGVEPRELKKFKPNYREFTIAKRSGGRRQILAPGDELKKMQRRILRRLLGRLRCHDAAHGFERGRSIVTNALPHRDQDVVIRMDLVDFFPSTKARRVKKYFRRIGWNRPAAKILTRLCTHKGSLPQGAPTSPRLSNLVNHRLDARLSGISRAVGGVYTRYADDITISFCEPPETEDWLIRSSFPPMNLEDHPDKVRFLLAFVHRVVGETGYRVHLRKKVSVRRRHHRQTVTGLVVNRGVNLSRAKRRWLRAVEHRMNRSKQSILETSDYSRRKQPTLTPAQLEGWQALLSMIEQQAAEEATIAPGNDIASR